MYRSITMPEWKQTWLPFRSGPYITPCLHLVRVKTERSVMLRSRGCCWRWSGRQPGALSWTPRPSNRWIRFSPGRLLRRREWRLDGGTHDPDRDAAECRYHPSRIDAGQDADRPDRRSSVGHLAGSAEEIRLCSSRFVGPRTADSNLSDQNWEPRAHRFVAIRRQTRRWM